MSKYPRGLDVVAGGNCPFGARSAMACMFCAEGHVTECHAGMDCGTAQCDHLKAYSDCPEDS
jgi:hypothetical protein